LRSVVIKEGHGHQLKIIIEKSLALIDSPLALHITHRYDIINNKNNSINNKDKSINSNIKDMKKLDRDKMKLLVFLGKQH